jgi:hypothetical protein
MTWSAQWRTRGHLDDAVFILDDGVVQAFGPANPLVLSRLLTDLGGLDNPDSGEVPDHATADLDAWGDLVLERGNSGEVLEVEPELFWHGIYSWFRSRGVDYDTPVLQPSALLDGAPALPMSVLMDD